MSPREITRQIHQYAAREGFSASRVARSEFLVSEAPKLEAWLRAGHQGDMSYMERNMDLRLDPSKLVPSAKSVVVLMLNYYQEPLASEPKVSVYAAGRDYHKVIKRKLKSVIRSLKTEIGDFAVRGFVDSAPVLERAWAVRSGLGFVGKNGNLIAPRAGSFFFLATLICDLELEYDAPFATDHCGDCTLCIDACPTQAILPGRVVAGDKCISYYTIETKDSDWQADKPHMDSWLFGCDVCQTVCPWNRFSIPTSEPDFTAKTQLQNWTYDDWNQMTESEFEEVFFDSPLKRKGYEGLRSTLEYLHDNKKAE